MANRNKTPKPSLIDKERRVLELRRAGATFDEIAKVVGYATPQGAYLAYHRAIKRVLVESGAEEALEAELDRCDRIQRAFWQQAMQGDTKAGLIVLRVMDRRAKYLGLDAPTKQQIEVTNYDAGSEVDRELQRLVRLLETGDSAESAVADTASTTEPN